MDAGELLMQFGLTRQEAIIYLSLLVEGEQTGYEVAKTTGISRSNAYTSLAALVEKGAALTVEDRATRYTPVPVEEFSENKLKKMQQVREQLLQAMPQRKELTAGYLTIKGQSHILDKMRHMILQAQERVYLSAAHGVIMEVLPELRKAVEHGMKVVLITDTHLELHEATVYINQKTQYPIRLIADTAKVLTGDLFGENPSCLYSAKKNLVDLLKDSLKNEIELIEIRKGSRQNEKDIR